MTPLHTAHASISVAALMYARALVMVLPALSVLYVLKTNVQIMMLVQQAYGSGNHVIMLSCKWALILVLPAAAFFLKDAGANALQPDQSCCAWPKQNSMCLFWCAKWLCMGLGCRGLSHAHSSAMLCASLIVPWCLSSLLHC